MVKKPEKNSKKYEEYNHLKNEKSPYLLQHATNPVDWYPWGDKAFEKAKKEKKLIFLSIGYSTCHWCHVMEKESFEDPEVAQLMNETFVSIKVDREERPDIDNIYMSICQMLTGSGGWPLTIIMTPTKKPFFAGTYFPKKSQYGRPGLLELIPSIQDFWERRREEVLESANEIIERLQDISKNENGEPEEELLDNTYKELNLFFDEQFGGFNGAPKFPTAHKLLFLLRYWKRTGKDRALRIVETTLQNMYQGGLFDHIGFGFHRYATDYRWLLPHFEKMLYDQALLALIYLETYQATQKDKYRTITEKIFTYVLRDMTDIKGGFYSAEDADSEGEEGKYYVWTEQEINQLLSKEEAELAIKIFSIEKDGNYREEATRKKTGKNILHLKKSLAKYSEELQLSEKKLLNRVETIRKKLFQERGKRVRPHKDDKILTDWNGLMIASLAKAGRVLQKEEYVNAAKKAADFIFSHLQGENGRLLHRYREGEAKIPANINDYSFFIWSLIELYETTFEASYLKEALRLNSDLFSHFWDKDHGGFYFTPDDGEKLLVRNKEVYDGAIPSGNSVALLNLLRFGRITGNPEIEEQAIKLAQVFYPTIKQKPSAYTMFVTALGFYFGPTYEVIVVGDRKGEDTQKLLEAIRTKFIPNKIVLLYPILEERAEILQITDLVEFKSMKNNKATVYVCKNRVCKFPTNDVNKMLNLLDVPKTAR
ncbi:MAG: DUF255 domain-containing protein [Candidatus Heimdallarchaeota archaeon]|nr:DUF255 domain-containing protein [Candidatus Heimdallarchaeota archaeon]